MATIMILYLIHPSSLDAALCDDAPDAGDRMTAAHRAPALLVVLAVEETGHVEIPVIVLFLDTLILGPRPAARQQ